MDPAVVRRLHQTFRADITLPEWIKRHGEAIPFRMPAAGREILASLLEQARSCAQARRQRIARLATPAHLRAAGRTTRRLIGAMHGLDAMPRPTPLSVERVGVLAPSAHYHIEKIIYQSRPGLYVTANVYVPQGDSPHPAVIFCLGHAPEGKAYAKYQHFCAELAINGMLVLCQDPLGQGERDEYLNYSNGQGTIARACHAHGVAGDPMYLTGSSFGGYRLWDAMRGIDYLESRKDVDATRIGAAGMSGGGWESLWLAAIDRRIVAVHSGAYTTTMIRRMENRSADPEPDPEQDAFGFLSSGLDVADIIMASHPAAVSLSMLRRDFFPLDGAEVVFKEVKAVYRRCGIPDRIFARVFPGDHGGSHHARVRYCVASLKRDLAIAGLQRTCSRFTPFSERALATSPGPNIVADRDGVTSAELHARTVMALASARARTPLSAAVIQKRLAKLLGIQRFPRVRAESPDDQGPGVTIVIGQASKKLVSRFTAANQRIVRLQPLAIERTDEHHHGFIPLVEAGLSYNAMLVGRCLAGMRVERICEEIARHAQAKITLLGVGLSAPLALFTAAVDGRVSRCIEVGGIHSLQSLCLQREYRYPVSGMVPQLLRYMDLPDIRAAIAPRQLFVVDPVDHCGQPWAG